MSDLLQSGHHPDADQLNAFVEHSLPPHEYQQTLAHLAVCPDCRTIVALSLPPIEESPAPQPEPARRPWFSGWKLAWPAAAAALAALTFFIVHNTTGNNSAAPTQMAASHPPAPLAATEAPPISAPQPPAQRSAKPQPATPRPTIARDATAKSPSIDAVIDTQSITNLPVQGRNVMPLTLRSPAAAPAIAVDRVQQGASSANVAAAPPPSAATVSSVNQSVEVTDAAPDVALSSSSIDSVLALNQEQKALPQRSLPSGLPALSMASTAHRTIAIDTQNTLFFSDDDGKHWKTIPSQWQGRAVKVVLTSSTRPPSVNSGVVNGASSSSRFAVVGGLASPTGQTNSFLAGTVTDASGAVIPDASVAVGNAATPALRTVKTDRSGRYVIDHLAPGSYQIEAQATGFQKQQLAVTLAPAQQSLANLTLPVGQASETVEVEASAMPLVEPAGAGKKIAAPPPVSQLLPLFEITTDTGDHWTSTDGQTWKHK